MTLNASKLRNDVYRLLDSVLETGKPLEIERKGKKLFIVPEKKKSRLGNLVKHECIKGDPEDLVHMDWSKEWKHDIS